MSPASPPAPPGPTALPPQLLFPQLLLFPPLLISCFHNFQGSVAQWLETLETPPGLHGFWRDPTTSPAQGFSHYVTFPDQLPHTPSGKDESTPSLDCEER